MRRINSGTANPREVDESVLRRGKSSESPTMEARGLGRTVPHTPVIAQSWGRSYTQQPQVGQSTVGFHTFLLTQDVFSSDDAGS